MADIYIAFSAFANPPTRKTGTDVQAAFPQITGWTVYNGPFEFPLGTPRAPGVIVHTSNPEPDPDEAAIVTAATTHDGSDHPPRFGTAFPVVNTAADLPAQPPDVGNDIALMAGVVNPDPALYFYAFGAWRGPIPVPI